MGTANAAKQKTCAQTLTQMLKMNQVTKAHQRAAESARPMPVSLQGPPEPPTQLALALATPLLRTRFGRSKLAMVLLLPNTLFPTDTAMLTLALRTLPLLVQPRPSKV